jgi:hypothetical protein
MVYPLLCAQNWPLDFFNLRLMPCTRTIKNLRRALLQAKIRTAIVNRSPDELRAMCQVVLAETPAGARHRFRKRPCTESWTAGSSRISF